LCGNHQNKQEGYDKETARNNLQKGKTTAQHGGPVCVLQCYDKKYVNNYLNVSCSLSPDNSEEGERETEACVCDSL
jgi:hypothetical protein